MVGFTYCGKSTEDIIGVPLYLVNQNNIDGLSSSRSRVEGERTISRSVTNEYGTISDPLTFTYGLIKSDNEAFTTQEQVKIERWLTSPKYSSELIITNCDEEEYSYFGLFTGTNWVTGGRDGFELCEFTFSVNGSHAFQSSDETVWAADEAIFQSVGSTTGTIEYDCKSDEPDEYVYPIIRATAKAGSSSSSFTFTNVTDGNRSVTVTTSQTITVILDCKNCRVYTGSKSGSGELIEISQLRFKDLGWRDVDNIYWPRLIPGTNILKISGDVVFEISYRSPYKKVGGWLV